MTNTRREFNKFFRAVRLNTDCFGSLILEFVQNLSDSELALARQLASRNDSDPLVLRRLERELWGAK